MDLSAFYGAFSPACFALLGLWLVAVQVRLPVWVIFRRHDAPLPTGGLPSKAETLAGTRNCTPRNDR